MSLTTRIESLVPRLAHFKSEVAQQIKALHPKKVLVKNWGRFVQGMKIAAFHVRRFAHGVSDRIPRVRISARRVVQVRAEEAILGNRIKAKSREGIALNPEDAERLKRQPGFEVKPREIVSDGQKTSVEFLVKVKSNALKDADKQFETDLAAYAKARVALDAKQLKRPDEVTQEEINELNQLEEKLQSSQDELTYLRGWATELKYKELGSQFDTEAALRDAFRVQVKTLSLQKSNAMNLVQGVTANIASVTQDRLDIDSGIREVSEKYRNRVYKDIIAFIDNPDRNSEHNTLVRAQRNRQMIWGTDKLKFATAEAGHSRRLPGLDYYMCAARENWPQDTPLYKDRLVKEAVRLMHNDWSLFANDVQSEIDKIRVDIDKENGRGSFDADKMWEYHHLRSFQETLAKLRSFVTPDNANSQSQVVDFLSSYGEELGLGEHPGYNLDELMKQAQSRYSVNSFKLLEESVARTANGTDMHPEYLPIPPDGSEPLTTVYEPFVEKPSISPKNPSLEDEQKEEASGQPVYGPFAGKPTISSKNPFFEDIQKKEASGQPVYDPFVGKPTISPANPFFENLRKKQAPGQLGSDWETFGDTTDDVTPPMTPVKTESSQPFQGSENASRNNPDPSE
ncbi:hypothetical protein [Endozoicomonas sp. ONNA1]|uniref:hypothetical protein n=1 Tax=Endozoicomonas sp. ONNA1 TaxID=2828740 RepID=UPI0021489701|nr:hypothetical protein [Endozoicomonas sp. ONNA1]